MGYATAPDDYVRYSVVGTAFGQLTLPQLQAQLDAASAEFDACARARYSFPLLPPYDITIVMHVVHYATYLALCQRGFDPQNPGDMAARDMWIAARDWFDKVQRQYAHPLVNESAPPTDQKQPQYAAPLVVGNPLQGWIPAEGHTFYRPSGIQ